MIQDPETVVNAIGPLSILVPQYQDPALSAAVRSMGLSRTLTPQAGKGIFYDGNGACEHIDSTRFSRSWECNGAVAHVDSPRQDC